MEEERKVAVHSGPTQTGSGANGAYQDVADKMTPAQVQGTAGKAMPPKPTREQVEIETGTFHAECLMRYWSSTNFEVWLEGEDAEVQRGCAWYNSAVAD